MYLRGHNTPFLASYPTRVKLNEKLSTWIIIFMRILRSLMIIEKYTYAFRGESFKSIVDIINSSSQIFIDFKHIKFVSFIIIYSPSIYDIGLLSLESISIGDLK